MVEKDQEEKSSKVLINDIWEYHFLTETCQMSRADAPTKTHKGTRPVRSLPSAVSIMLERLWPRLIPRTTALEGKSTLGPLETVAAAVTSGGGVLFSERAKGDKRGGKFHPSTSPWQILPCN